MAQPLTGTYLDGSPHLRPPEVEQAIDDTLRLPRDEIARRLQIAARGHPDYLQEEVLLHLIRNTVRENSEAYFGKLYLVLRARVLRRLPGGNDTTSERIRELVVDMLTELITRDRSERLGRLDIFECRFERGMKLLIAEAKRRVLPKTSPVTSFDVSDEFNIPIEIIEGIRRLDVSHGDFSSDPHFRSDLIRAIATLPENERRVATLMLLDLPDVDTVTDSPSISKAMGRSARMIQEYRKSAAQKLRRILVEGEE